jgi:predicted ester cyclase
MSVKTTANKAIVRRIYEDLWNKGNMAAADEIFARPESVKQYVRTFLAAFPDLQHTIEEMIAEGDTVMAHFSARGTHTGQWHTVAPTNKQIAYEGVTIAHVKNGKIMKHQTTWDTLGVLEQLGLVPLIRKADGSRL